MAPAERTARRFGSHTIWPGPPPRHRVRNHRKIDTVSHGHGLGANGQVIIDVGGFLGLGKTSFLMAAKDLIFMRDDKGSVQGLTGWTKDQVRVLPEHDH